MLRDAFSGLSCSIVLLYSPLFLLRCEMRSELSSSEIRAMNLISVEAVEHVRKKQGMFDLSKRFIGIDDGFDFKVRLGKKSAIFPSITRYERNRTRSRTVHFISLQLLQSSKVL
ncbi:hypothetical protein P153DRAFT_210473 [Dothidotthia symphoricarpi CBS 119687]|uniref:Uncharacterized protein n=1 Tax=Dothidotthia symphoricarpi CBS 119687 TaxID=1392245 RepID=A0A6A6AGF6_9PLEO|nr:uncharacterized protein P153DRAFT_210473 [Dothidotthia symphoricarpi CBS 119687]KAF2131072.1 hypothetical protein P153DRAFT_210473 [Dothidotthia symphoricarpi CBS 119687]